ncbi:MAG: hypothetical protein AB1427_04120 [Thermodesulfobacteriota bacterium]
MYRRFMIFLIMAGLFVSAGCARTYQAKPLPFKSPASFKNVVEVAGAQVAARAYADPGEAKEAFGFDIRSAGMLPVQVIFDNQGSHPLEINGLQTFLEDNDGNLWPILNREMAYERATKYAQTKEIFTEGAYKGFLGAAAGAIVGAAIGIVSGENAAATAGKGAAVGAAAGAVLGGAGGYASGEARRKITNDLREKSLQNQAVDPKSLAHGFIFFPGEALSAKQLRLQLLEKDTGKVHVLNFSF